MSNSATFLMCPPRFFGVAYVINPWMEGNNGRVDVNRAARQWHALHAALSQCAQIEIVEPEAGLPDMVFTANAGFVLDGRAVPARFHHAERAGEEPHFEGWFRSHGFEVLTLPEDLVFEGAGDALYDRTRDCVWIAYGRRTRAAAGVMLRETLGVETVPLRLMDPRYYHLDTCFCPLDDGWLLWYPPAFDAAARAEVERRVPAERRIAVGEEDAKHFACNAVCVGGHVILNRATPALAARLREAGLRVIQTPLDEFIKAGGAAKCLTLRLDESRGARGESALRAA